MEPQVEARQSKVTARWTFLSLHLYLRLDLLQYLKRLLSDSLSAVGKPLNLTQVQSSDFQVLRHPTYG